MSEWERFRWSRAPKRPPPEHGIQLEKAGATWWGRRWIEALEHVLRGDAGRLARGKSYARAGRTHDLVVKGGEVTARVTGTRPTPYRVRIQLAELPDEVWQRAIEGLAEKAQFAAALLAGEMPEPIDEVFHAAGASLFPEQRRELATSCSCPDAGDPCKHVAATHYLLGEALDHDPFLLFELRGRSKERVLGGIRAARTGDAPPTAGAAAPEPGAVVPAVTLAGLAPSDYDRPRGALPALEFSFEAPSTPAAVLRQLGAPRAWRGEQSPAQLLAPQVQRAAEAARRIALGDPELAGLEEESEAARPGPVAPAPGRLDVAGASEARPGKKRKKKRAAKPTGKQTGQKPGATRAAATARSAPRSRRS